MGSDFLLEPIGQQNARTIRGMRATKRRGTILSISRPLLLAIAIGTLAAFLPRGWNSDTPSVEASHPSGMRLPFVGHASYYTYSGHPPPYARDVAPKDPNKWNGTIVAMASGKVIYAGSRDVSRYCDFKPSSAQNEVVIEHNIGGQRYTSVYLHLSSISVAVNRSVSAGATVGTYGKTGCATGLHLHFEVWKGGTWGNRWDLGTNLKVDDLPGVNSLGTSGCCGGDAVGPTAGTTGVGDEVQAYWANLVGGDKEDALVYNPVTGGYAIWDFSTDTQARSGSWSPGWTHVVLGNFTGDSHTDAIVYNQSKGAGDEISAVLIDFNPPGGTYQQVRTYSWNPGWTKIIGGNFVGDGWDELLFYKSAVGSAVVWDPRTDSLLVSKSWSAGWTHVIRGNFAGDSHSDILVYNSAKTTDNVVVTDFAAGEQTFVGSWSTGWTHIVPGDMVGDSHTDVLAYSKNRVTAAVVDFTGSPSIPYDLGTGFTNVVTGDLLGDSKHEALLYNATTGNVIVFNFSTGTKAVDRTWSTGWAQTLTGNFVGDSKRDVLVYNPSTGVAAIVSFSPSYAQPWTKTWSKGWIVYS